MIAPVNYPLLLSFPSKCGKLIEEKKYPNYNASIFRTISFATLTDTNSTGLSSIYNTTLNVLWLNVNTTYTWDVTVC